MSIEKGRLSPLKSKSASALNQATPSPKSRPSIICKIKMPRHLPIISDDLLIETNKNIFKNDSFRSCQQEIIRSVLNNQDTFVCMPTGGGKSLTFQLPAYLSEGITIVIMPLISLIHDQVKRLEDLNIPHRVISGNLKKSEESLLYSEILNDLSLKIVFITPEKLAKSDKSNELLHQLHRQERISRFVIDEAHCVSKWGREFRADYLKLSSLRLEFQTVSILALTGTATEQVSADVIQVLRMKSPKIFIMSFNRKNLFYQVIHKTSKVLEDIGNFIKTYHPTHSGLIYCITKKDCEKVSRYLKNEHQISCGFYHATVAQSTRDRNQDLWMLGELQVLVATIAFGMGIDKQNVRFVIHYSFPKSLENYYQESGRAGRDGLKSTCLIYFNFQDKNKHDSLINSSKRQAVNFNELYLVMKYCENQLVCRRKQILGYFGENFDQKECRELCDNCKDKRDGSSKNVDKEALLVLELVSDLPNGISTLIQVAGYLKGSIQKKKSNWKSDERYGKLNDCNIKEIECIIRHMIYEGILTERCLKMFNKFKVTQLQVGPNAEKFRRGSINIVIVIALAKFRAAVPLNSVPNSEPSEAKTYDSEKFSSDETIEPKEITFGSEDENSIECEEKEDIGGNDIQEDDYGMCKTFEVFDDLLSRMKLVRKKISREERKDSQEVIPDSELFKVVRNMNGDAHPGFLKEINHFKEIYNMKQLNEPHRFQLDLDHLDEVLINYKKPKLK